MPQFITGDTATTISINDTIHRIIVASATVRGDGIAGVEFGAGSAPGKLTIAGAVSSNNSPSSDGILMNGNDQVTILQTGSVFGTDDGIVNSNLDSTILVAGYVFGGDSGIFSSGIDTVVTIAKTGVVQGGSNRQGNDVSNPFAAAITMTSSETQTIVNHGTIVADVNPTTGGTIAVLNAGSGGTTNDLDFNPNFSGVLNFYNTGAVEGDVFFAAGDDLYDARGGGTVSGVIDMGADDDTFRGGAADEDVIFSFGDDLGHGGGGDDTLRGQLGDDTLNGADGDDVLLGGGENDVLIGGSGNDTLDGGDGNDLLRGSAGDDDLNGGQGIDMIYGGSGDDDLVGLGGRDMLNGGSGDDEMTGSGGFDTFVFVGSFGNDTITDFNLANFEKIDVSGVTGIINPADLFANHLQQDGADAVFDDLNGNTITIENTLVGDLDNGDFILN